MEYSYRVNTCSNKCMLLKLVTSLSGWLSIEFITWSINAHCYWQCAATGILSSTFHRFVQQTARFFYSHKNYEKIIYMYFYIFLIRDKKWTRHGTWEDVQSMTQSEENWWLNSPDLILYILGRSCLPKARVLLQELPALFQGRTHLHHSFNQLFHQYPVVIVCCFSISFFALITLPFSSSVMNP